MKLTFLGATGTVTGSKYLLEADNKLILVDCGLFQGLKELRLRNWEELPIVPSKIDAVILTHAHIDHSGYVPLLIKNGFRGKIYCSRATRDLCSILLPDSGYLHEEDARRANKYGYTRHRPAIPLYTQQEALESLDYFYPIEFGKNIELTKNLIFHLNRAGHILGSSFVTIKSDNKTVVFSGDIGRLYDPIVKSPAIIKSADYIVMESTYGDRLHKQIDVSMQICKIVNQTIKRGGTLLIPSFAVGRAQSIMYHIYMQKKRGCIPNVPVYLDSPMAIDASRIFHFYAGEHRMSKKQCEEICGVAKYVRTQQQSKAIDLDVSPKIIISASGMATGGRVLHHLKIFASDAKNTILFAGYQAEGTRGDKMVRGATEIKIHGEMFPIRAQVELLENISAHADYGEILEWLSNFKHAPRKVFITHGEKGASQSLKAKIEKRFGWNCVIPEFAQTEVL